jgi:hypothetical protein
MQVVSSKADCDGSAGRRAQGTFGPVIQPKTGHPAS